jgi:hypothetical protein
MAAEPQGFAQVPQTQEETGGMSPKRHRAIRAGRSVPLAAAIIAIGVSAVAIGAVQKRAARTIPAQHAGSVTAKCKRGLTPVAGGFAAPGFTPTADTGPVFRFASKPAGKRGIKAAAFNFSDDPHELDSYAYCAKRAHPLRIKAKRVRLFPGSFGSAVARCPHGRQAVGGGFKTNSFTLTQGAAIFTFTSKRAGKRGWKAAGLNVGSPGGGNPAGRLTAYAYCQKGRPKVRVRSKTVTAPALSIRNVDVKCPHRRKALSGGFNGHYGISGGGLRVAAAITSKRGARARAWHTAALGLTSPNPARITAYVYCGR